MYVVLEWDYPVVLWDEARSPSVRHVALVGQLGNSRARQMQLDVAKFLFLHFFWLFFIT